MQVRPSDVNTTKVRSIYFLNSPGINDIYIGADGNIATVRATGLMGEVVYGEESTATVVDLLINQAHVRWDNGEYTGQYGILKKQSFTLERHGKKFEKY